MNEHGTTADRLLVHDLGPGVSPLPEGVQAIDALAIQQPCIGCFGCWIKTPSACVIRDGFADLGARFFCGELVVVTRCTYGGVSPAVKNILDRCIGCLLPFFTLRGDGQMHHATRYPSPQRITMHFYGDDITPGEAKTARALAERNAINLNAGECVVAFSNEAPEIGRCLA